MSGPVGEATCGPPRSDTRPPPRRWRHVQKGLALLCWAGAFGGYQWYAWRHGLAPLAAAQRLVALLGAGGYGPLLYILAYVLRPLVLFPSILLTVAGGFVFGPVWGVLYTIIGGNASALLAYLVGRFFGRGVLEDGAARGLARRYAARLRRHGFETVFILRLLFVPYDAVNYLAGFLRIRWAPFLLATALGSVPATIAVVLFGASLARFDGSLPSLDHRALAASAALFLFGVGLARLFRRREGRRGDGPARGEGD